MAAVSWRIVLPTRRTGTTRTLTAFEIGETWRRFRAKQSQEHTLLAFGHGDGGGGPTPEMLERFRRFRDFPGLPNLQIGRVARVLRKDFDSIAAGLGRRKIPGIPPSHVHDPGKDQASSPPIGARSGGSGNGRYARCARAEQRHTRKKHFAVCGRSSC